MISSKKNVFDKWSTSRMSAKKAECKCSDFLPQRCQKYNETITQVVVGYIQHAIETKLDTTEKDPCRGGGGVDVSNEIFVLGEGKRGVQKGIFPAS